MQQRLRFSWIPAIAAAGLLTAGCGDDGSSGSPDASPPADATVVPDAEVDAAPMPALPPDWDAEVRPVIAEDINPDPDIVEVELVAEEAEIELADGTTTTMYTYNGVFPGPQIEAEVGDRLIVNFTNNLPEETTIHWHGVELPANMDGSNLAQLAVPADGGTFTYDFTLLGAATYWYHPHIRTNEQVEKGLYGTLVVRDPAEDESLALPEDELVLVLDDILLEGDGAVAPAFPEDPVANAAVHFNGREGNTFLVNGRVLPTVKAVSGIPIRMRLVNPANARFFRVSIPGHELHRIGGDAGLIAEPVARAPIEQIPDPDDSSAMISDPDPDLGVMLVPGERAEVVFTPTGETGSEIFLEWHDYPRGRHATFDNGGSIGFGDAEDDGKRPSVQLLRFEIVDSIPDAEAYTPPASLRPAAPIDTSAADGLDPLAVTFGHGPPAADGSVTFFATKPADGPGVPFDELTPEQALQAFVGETRIIEVTNLTGGDHPFHLHGFFFQHLETEFIDADNPDNNRVEQAPRVEDKDTILVPARPGAAGQSRTVVRLAVSFDDTGREGTVAAADKTPTDTTSGGWVLHCHILEHADNGMMSFLNLRQPPE